MDKIIYQKSGENPLPEHYILRPSKEQELSSFIHYLWMILNIVFMVINLGTNIAIFTYSWKLVEILSPYGFLFLFVLFFNLYNLAFTLGFARDHLTLKIMRIYGQAIVILSGAMLVQIVMFYINMETQEDAQEFLGMALLFFYYNLVPTLQAIMFLLYTRELKLAQVEKLVLSGHYEQAYQVYSQPMV